MWKEGKETQRKGRKEYTEERREEWRDTERELEVGKCALENRVVPP